MPDKEVRPLINLKGEDWESYANILSEEVPGGLDFGFIDDYSKEVEALIKTQRDEDQLWHDAKMEAKEKEWREKEAKLCEAVSQFLEIVNESEGITGWHLNGAILTWAQCEQIQMMQNALAELRNPAPEASEDKYEIK